MKNEGALRTMYTITTVAAVVIVVLLTIGAVRLFILADVVDKQTAFEIQQVAEHRAVSRCAYHETAIAQRALLVSLRDLATQAETLDPAGVNEALKTLHPPANVDGLDCDKLLRSFPRTLEGNE